MSHGDATSGRTGQRARHLTVGPVRAVAGRRGGKGKSEETAGRGAAAGHGGPVARSHLELETVRDARARQLIDVCSMHVVC